MRVPIIAGILFVFFLPALSLAQVTTGSIEGFILNQDEQPLAGARIIVTSPNLQGSRTFTSGSNGYFAFPGLPVGEYRVSVTTEGYRDESLEGIQVRLGRTTSLSNIFLVEIAYELEDLVVHGGPALIDPVATYSGDNLVSEDFNNLPLERDYANMTVLLPHANTSFLTSSGEAGVDFSGATFLENRYFIDGVDVTEPFWGDGGLALPYNFIDEVQVRTGAYQAEYRSSLGGVVDVITHSGSNDFQGYVFGFYTDDKLAKEEQLPVGAPLGGDFKSYDFGFGLSGALKKDKLWYSCSFNPGVANREVAIPTLGYYPDETHTFNVAAKLNWRLNEANDLAFSFLSSSSKRSAVSNPLEGDIPSPTEIANADNYLMDIDNTPLIFSLEGFHWVGDNLFLESSASLHQQVYERVPSTETGRNEPFFFDQATGVWAGGAPFKLLRNDFTTVDLGVKGTVVADRHTSKLGLDFRQRKGTQKAGYSMLLRMPDGTYISIYGGEGYGDGVETDYETTNRIFSAFAQDTWRLTERMRLNLGVRWDGQRILGSNGEVGLSILDQWQPRLGFTYQVGPIGRRKFFGNYGRFYQEVGSPVANYFTPGGYAATVAYDHDPREDPSGGIVVEESFPSPIPDRIEGIDGQYYDEFTLGYEHALGGSSKIVVRGTYRTMGKGVEDAYVDDTEYVIGNPGYGLLAEFPRIEREYQALEFTFKARPSPRTGVFATYVLSRNRGNYSGLFSTTYGSPFPNRTEDFDILATTVNSNGLMTNDRPHVLKIYGWYTTGFGLTIGATGWWMSGTPLSEYAQLQTANATRRAFVSTRGTAGRTPSIWDLNLRFAYALPFRSGDTHPQLILDLMHVGNPREAVNFDQIHYLGYDVEGNPAYPNPNYRVATNWQPPMIVRLGLQVGF